MYGGLHAYLAAVKIEREYPYGSFLMAAMLHADSKNTKILKAAYPDLYQETAERYRNPGGLTDAEMLLAEEVG